MIIINYNIIDYILKFNSRIIYNPKPKYVYELSVSILSCESNNIQYPKYGHNKYMNYLDFFNNSHEIILYIHAHAYNIYLNNNIEKKQNVFTFLFDYFYILKIIK